MPTSRVLMVQGTSSSVGKSLLVAGLCRLFVRRGIKVAPFKAQNMSNNAGVCADGGEIGRAQAVQARAAGVAPTVDMNPVLLKPEADHRSQVIVQGSAWKTLNARNYFERKQLLWNVVAESLDRLRSQVDLVIIEGAGSPVELNLAASDIVNMAVARHACSPVLLVGDIDRGGVFAQLIGTLALLEPEVRRLVCGLIVNKFRGDPTLFADGISILETRGGVPVLGVVPYLAGLDLPEEDAATLDDDRYAAAEDKLDIVVVRLPRISNFDDFDPLAAEPGVSVRYVDSAAALGRPMAIVLPGTKSTMADLAWLCQRGLANAIIRLAKEGTAVVGLCGGYQMLGKTLHDPSGVERSSDVPATAAGLDLLPITTTFVKPKATYLAEGTINSGPGWLEHERGTGVSGYEIHAGRSETACPWLTIVRRNGEPVQISDGAVSADGRIWGCYLHGLFAADRFRAAWLASLGHAASAGPHARREEAAFDRLADALEASLDLALLDRIIAQGVDEP